MVYPTITSMRDKPLIYKRLVDTFIYFKSSNKYNSKLKGASKYKTLEKITKQEMSYLINLKILKLFHGNYGDNLVVIGKFSSGLRKQRYITDPYYNYLLKLKQNDKNKQTIDDVRDNQKYLFMDNMDSRTSNSECVL